MSCTRSSTFDMDDWQPDGIVPIHSGKRETAIYRFTIPGARDTSERRSAE
jgi:hypothetical protein